MLRIILGLTGAGLIGFGLFGGHSLQMAHEKVIGIIGADDGGVLAQSSEPASPGPETESAVSSIATDSSPAVSAQATTEATSDVAQAVSDTGDAQTDEPLETMASQTVAAITVTDTGDEETATSERSLDIETTTNPVKEVKASARDSELAIARALLDPDNVNVTPDENESGVAPAAIATRLSANEATADAAMQLADDNKENTVTDILQTTNGESANNTLFVLKETVNLRGGPSISHPIVLQLEKGQELMEFKRDGKWVHVGAYGTSGKIGWVHTTLVGQINN